jgi:tRNA (guanine37-N1)-methyltransferase
MHFSVLTIFTEMFTDFWGHGIVRRALADGHISAETVDIRDFAEGRHRVTDDRPYGGGCGMVMKPEPLAAAIRSCRKERPETRAVLLSPQGRAFDQTTARILAAESALILVCGRYEGIDERVCDHEIDIEVSIGDYVLTGGELAAMVVMDAVTRLLPGALGGEESAARESFEDGMLEHAQYTRPPLFQGEAVPEVLLSGHHGRIEQWRRETALVRTALKRPDLLMHRQLLPEEGAILRKWCADIGRILEAQSVLGAGSPPGGE